MSAKECHCPGSSLSLRTRCPTLYAIHKSLCIWLSALYVVYFILALRLIVLHRRDDGPGDAKKILFSFPRYFIYSFFAAPFKTFFLKRPPPPPSSRPYYLPLQEIYGDLLVEGNVKFKGTLSSNTVGDLDVDSLAARYSYSTEDSEHRVSMPHMLKGFYRIWMSFREIGPNILQRTYARLDTGS